MNKYGFLKVAAAVPNVKVADCAFNAERIYSIVEKAVARKVDIVAFPELSITGYTCGDLFVQPSLLKGAQNALGELVQKCADMPIVVIVGMPMAVENALYNCAVAFSAGAILGIVPKTYLPNYTEFYEARWFESGAAIKDSTVMLCGQEVDFGCDVAFALDDVAFGIEICEDMWVAIPPSSHLALGGAKVIFNLSASPEVMGKHAYLRSLIVQQSARTMSAYVYSSAGFGESSTDSVFAGNAIIADNGAIIASNRRFSVEEQLVVADVDVERIGSARLKTTTYNRLGSDHEYRFIPICSMREPSDCEPFDRQVDAHPFLPSSGEECHEILKIQASGLAQRLNHTNCKKAVIGISGGLDSTLALMVTAMAFDRLGLDRSGIIAITMPGFGTSNRTYKNAVELVREMGVTFREIPIRKACEQHFSDIGLSNEDRSTSYENSQARERTQILMDVSNMEGGIVIGTGDLSELALGWATYNGDHMSMYGVNASVSKTLARHIITWLSQNADSEAIRRLLADICDTPISPELLPSTSDDELAQLTESIVGPYELHDFFLYNFVRQGFSPSKILFLAEKAFAGKYQREYIIGCMRTFFGRFFSQQFKRSALPDGPKVGPVSLSPRGDWRMPSDASVEMWMAEIDSL